MRHTIARIVAIAAILILTAGIVVLAHHNAQLRDEISAIEQQDRCTRILGGRLDDDRPMNSAALVCFDILDVSER